MDESLHFFVEGVSVTLLLGDRQVETILTLRHLGYLIFNKSDPSTSRFPPTTHSLPIRTSSEHALPLAPSPHLHKKSSVFHPTTAATTSTLPIHPASTRPPAPPHSWRCPHEAITLLQPLIQCHPLCLCQEQCPPQHIWFCDCPHLLFPPRMTS